MGFCRRCGDIVHGPRCKCGGLPVGAWVVVAVSHVLNPSQRRRSRLAVRGRNAARIDGPKCKFLWSLWISAWGPGFRVWRVRDALKPALSFVLWTERALEFGIVTTVKLPGVAEFRGQHAAGELSFVHRGACLRFVLAIHTDAPLR